MKRSNKKERKCNLTERNHSLNFRDLNSILVNLLKKISVTG